MVGVRLASEAVACLLVEADTDTTTRGALDRASIVSRRERGVKTVLTRHEQAFGSAGEFASTVVLSSKGTVSSRDAGQEAR